VGRRKDRTKERGYEVDISCNTTDTGAKKGERGKKKKLE
jgi:hypothetical protein